MNRIRDWLYTGRYVDTASRSLLDLHGIGAMLQLAAPYEQPGIESLALLVEDAEPLPPGALEQGVAFIRTQKAAGKCVLVACGAGISRSTTFAIAALMEEEGLGLFAAYRDILRVHPHASPHPKLCQALVDHYGLGLAYEDIVSGLIQCWKR